MEVQNEKGDNIYSDIISSGVCTALSEASSRAQMRRNTYIDNHPQLSEFLKKQIFHGAVCIGMTPEQVVASWGNPNSINRTTGAWGVHEQWVYGTYMYGGKVKYLYFENDTLTTIQD